MSVSPIFQDIQKYYPQLINVGENGYLSIKYLEMIPLLLDYNKNLIGWGKKKYGRSSASFEQAILCNRDIKDCGSLFAYKFFFRKIDTPNKNFFHLYKKNINKITSKEFLDKFFKQRKKEILRINAKIYGDYFYTDNTYYYGPGLYYFNKNLVLFMGENGKQTLRDALMDWDFEYTEKKSITNKESFLLNIKNIKKRQQN